MEDEEGYTALNIQSRRPGSVSGRAASPPGNQDAPQSPHCHWIILCAVSFVIVLLLGAVIALEVLQLEKEIFGIDFCRVKCDSSLGDFQALLKNRLCNQAQSRSSVNSTCQLCPVHWYLHKEMCYWPSEGHKSWNESKNDCLVNDSQLLVIQDREEMEFIKQITRGIEAYWIGLFLSSSENKWMWVTGSQFDDNMFEGPQDTQRNFCGTIKDKIHSDKCSAVRRWICQKEPVLL